MIKRLLSFLIFFLLILPVQAKPLRVAVAANFRPVLETLAERYEETTDQQVSISSASTGVLYNQIVNGAPFDVFLSADSDRPKRLEIDGLAVAESRKPYARGQLVLWNTDNESISLKNLKDYNGRIALANPVTAPYGQAAREVMESLGIWPDIQKRLVQGNSIQQAWQFVATGNIKIGLVAKAQLQDEKYQQGQMIKIPQSMYNPIDQELVILKRSQQQKQAARFIVFLLSKPSQKYIGSQGYQTALLRKH